MTRGIQHHPPPNITPSLIALHNKVIIEAGKL
jgi:hypothetical protein